MGQDIKITKRIKIIKGHIGYLEKMIDEQKNCADIMTQSLAIQKSLKSLNRELLKNYLTCDAQKLFAQKDETTTKELTYLYHLSQD